MLYIVISAGTSVPVTLHVHDYHNPQRHLVYSGGSPLLEATYLVTSLVHRRTGVVIIRVEEGLYNNT